MLSTIREKNDTIKNKERLTIIKVKGNKWDQEYQFLSSYFYITDIFFNFDREQQRVWYFNDFLLNLISVYECAKRRRVARRQHYSYYFFKIVSLSYWWTGWNEDELGVTDTKDPKGSRRMRKRTVGMSEKGRNTTNWHDRPHFPCTSRPSIFIGI